MNRGSDGAAAVRFRWLVDGVPADSGTMDIPVGATDVSLTRPWSFERHRITFALLPDTLNDAEPADDTLTVITDALSVGFWVHERIYRWMLESGRPGFERQAQGWVADWNELLGREVWPSSPDGVLDRLRIERVTVLPDTAGYPHDVDTDLVWFFRNGANDPRFLNAGATDLVREDQTITLHELLHERGLTDLYAYEVLHTSTNGSVVGILENGVPVVGGPAMPLMFDRYVYQPHLNGVMGTLLRYPSRITEHSAFGLNQRAHLRTPSWYDAFGGRRNGFQIHAYVNLLPDTTAVRLRTTRGEVLGGAQVELFVDHGQFPYQDVYGPEPDRVFQADDQGVFRLPADILDGTPTLDFYPKPWTLILRVRTAAGRAYVFLPGYLLNLLYFRGERGLGHLDLTADPI
jgi:hypothetical protein